MTGLTRLLFMVTGLALAGCDGGKSFVQFECLSPQEEFIATYYAVQGGGAAGWQVLRVNIRKTTEQIDFDEFSFEMVNGVDLAMKWHDEVTLSIYYPHGADIREAKSSIYGTSQSEGIEHTIDVQYLGVESDEGHFVDHDTGCFN